MIRTVWQPVVNKTRPMIGTGRPMVQPVAETAHASDRWLVDPHLLGVLDLWQRSRQAGGRPELHIGPATHLQWWPSAASLLHFLIDI